MVTRSYPGSKTAAVHTAVTAEFWYSGTNDFDANPKLLDFATNDSYRHAVRLTIGAAVGRYMESAYPGPSTGIESTTKFQ